MSRVVQLAGVAAASFVLLAAAGCGQPAPATNEQSETTEALGNTKADDADAPAAPEVSASTSHSYSSREGDTFYYNAADGTAVGVQDQGWKLGNDDKFRRLLTVGSEVMTLEGGSSVIHTRVLSATSGGVVRANQGDSFPLDGPTVASVAMRDALGGHLSAPGSPPDMEAFKADLRAKREQCAAEGMEYRRERLSKDGPVREFSQKELDEFAAFDCGPPVN